MRRAGKHGPEGRFTRRGRVISETVDGMRWDTPVESRLAKMRGRPLIWLTVGIVALVGIASVGLLVSRSGSDSDGDGSVVQARESRVVEGRTWRVVQGEWRVADTISVVTPGRLYSSLIVTDGESADLTVQARMRVVASGAGLVFRYQDPFNYWAVEAVKGVVSWQVIKIVHGKSEIVGNTGYSPTAPGTVVSVSTRPDGVIDISLNGKKAKSFSDTTHAKSDGIGFVAHGPRADDAVFTEIRTVVAPPQS